MYTQSTPQHITTHLPSFIEEVVTVSRSAVETLFDADCQTLEKIVLMVIARHGQGTDGSGGRPSLRRIAKIAGVSCSTLHYVLISLRTKGWLSWNPGNASENKANTYTLHFDAIPMLPDLWRSSSQTRLAHRGSPASQPDSFTEAALPRFGSKPASPAEYQANTEANTKDDDRSSSSFSLSSIQEFWNRHRGLMRESKTQLTPHHKQLFAARVKDGFTETVCQQVISKMAALPYFRGEIDGNVGDFAWLLGTHKETGEPNFQKVLRGDYDPRAAPPKRQPVVARRPSYKDFADPDYERKLQ